MNRPSINQSNQIMSNRTHFVVPIKRKRPSQRRAPPTGPTRWSRTPAGRCTGAVHTPPALSARRLPNSSRSRGSATVGRGTGRKERQTGFKHSANMHSRINNVQQYVSNVCSKYKLQTCRDEKESNSDFFSALKHVSDERKSNTHHQNESLESINICLNPSINQSNREAVFHSLYCTDGLDGVGAGGPIQAHGAAFVVVGLCVHSHLQYEEGLVETLMKQNDGNPKLGHRHNSRR